MANRLRDFLFLKLFAPQVIIINQPGVIISKTTQKYGNTSSKRRMIFVFEDFCVAIQKALIEKIGNEKASSFYYRLGKDVGFYYLILSKSKKVSSFLIENILNYIFYTLSSVGQTFGEKVKIDVGKKYLCLEGFDNIISRKTSNISFFAGFASGVFSYLLEENIEANITMYDKKNNYTKIELSKDVPEFYLPDVNNIKKFIGNYEQNFPELKVAANFSSYKDLLRFNKIQIEDNGKNNIFGYSLLFSEVGFLALLVRYHQDNKYEILLQNSIVKESEKIFKNILPLGGTKEKLNFVSSLLSAFGWGIPEFNVSGKNIICNLKASLMYEGVLYLQTYSIKGILQAIFQKEVFIVNFSSTGVNCARLEFSF